MSTTFRLPLTNSGSRRWGWSHRVISPAVHESAPAKIEFTWANRRPGTTGFARWAASVGRHIDEHGIAVTEHDVQNLVAVARQHGISAAAVDVLAGPSEPEVARCRAFAKVVTALVPV